MKSLLMVCCVALVLLLATAVHAAYDLESAKIVQSNAVFAEGSVFLGQNGSDIIFGFKAKAAVSVTTNHSFRSRLPPHFTGDTLLNPSGITCQIESQGQTVAVGTVERITAYGASSVDLRCTPTGPFTLTAAAVYIVRFKGCGLKDGVALTPGCDSGLLPTGFTPGPFSGFIGLFAGFWASAGSNCCTNAYFALFLSTETCLDSFSNFDGSCNISRTGSCYGGCAPDNTKLSGLTVTAAPVPSSEPANVSKTTQILTLKFTSLVQIKGTDLVGPSTTQGLPTVPGYLRTTLPGYSATLTDQSNPYTSNLTCSIAIDGVAQTPVEGTDVDQYSPAVVARYIKSGSGGIIVYCALRKSVNIPVGAKVTVTIGNVISPIQGDACTRCNARTSTSSACCGGIVTAVVRGNFDQTASLYTSLPAQSCPVFYTTPLAAQNANSNEIGRDLNFYPLTISTFASSSTTTIDPSSTTGLVSNAYYRFQVASAGLVKASTFTLSLPGFRLRVASATVVKVHFIANDDDAQAEDVTLSVISFGSTLRLTGPLPFNLTVGTYYTIFFPELYATDRLPTASQCSQAVSGSATSDAFCCQSFFIQFTIGASSVYVYASTCPIRPSNGNNWSLGEWCLRKAEEEPTRFFPECCSASTPSDDTFFGQCVDYYCGQDANPADWIPGLCCNADAASRSSERCCAGTDFCAQFCCGAEIEPDSAEIPAPPRFYPFIPEKCCAARPNLPETVTPDSPDYYFYEIENIENICQCYFDFDATDYSNSKVLECCLPDGTTPALAPRHPVCQCVILYNLLNPAAPAPVLTADQRNTTLVTFMDANPGFDPNSCCIISAHARSWNPGETSGLPGTVPEGDIADPILEAWLEDPICTCIAAGNIRGQDTYPADLECCEYDYFADNCPQQCTAPTDCPGCGSGCGNGSDCSCCKQNRINISDLKSGEDINIAVGSNPTRVRSREL